MPLSYAQHPVFGFAGELHDPLSGLVYLRARWYDPDSGTLLTTDPYHGGWQQPYGHHPYQYAYSNPLRFADPSGEVPVLLIIGGVILVGAWLATPPSVYAPSTVEVPAITALPSQKNALGLYPNDTMVLEAGFDTVNDATVLVTGHGVLGGEGDRLMAMGALVIPGVGSKHIECMAGWSSLRQRIGLRQFGDLAKRVNGNDSLPVWRGDKLSAMIGRYDRGSMYALLDSNEIRATMVTRTPSQFMTDSFFPGRDPESILELVYLESTVSGGGRQMLQYAAQLARQQGKQTIFLGAANTEDTLKFYHRVHGRNPDVIDPKNGTRTPSDTFFVWEEGDEIDYLLSPENFDPAR